MNKEILLPADLSYSPATSLHAGQVRMNYEEGKLRYIRCGGEEIVRLIYPALRAADWSTIVPSITDEKIDRKKDSFRISYNAHYSAKDIGYQAAFTIEGSADGTVVFSMEGVALTDFLKSRVGVCLLSPVPHGETKLTVGRPDGSSYSGSFPMTVSPDQPFLDVARLSWTTASGQEIKVIFSGEGFETEDQRNWSDNSFKTYSTPLALPSPAQVRKGDKLQHVLTIKAAAKKSSGQADTQKNEELISFPGIGYARAVDGTLDDDEIDMLLAIPFDHYRVELNLSGNWKETLQQAAAEARKLNTRLELAVRFSALSQEEIGDFAGVLDGYRDMISSVLILADRQETAPMEFFEEVRDAIKHIARHIPVGYGTDDHFADLNRNRPTGNKYDFVSFSLHPQVHAADSRTIMENLGSHEALIRSAKQFTEGKSVHISPVRFGPADVADERFGSSFAAWWTLQALRNLSEATALTFFQVNGRNGLIQDKKPTKIYEVFRQIAAFVPRFVVRTGDEQEVVFENKAGHRLVFRSALPRLDQTITE